MTQAYPLAWPDGWPRNAPVDRANPRSRFGVDLTLYKAVTRLYDELRRLGATNIIVSTNVEPRLDGMPRSGTAAPLDPGAAVYFHYGDEPMVMANDQWTKIEANVNALALAISHLRGLERHGGGFMMKRAFAGFTALPPPGQPQSVAVNWREELGPLPGGLEKADLLVIAENRYRKKAAAAHADVGGDDSKMIRLNAAIADARKELGA